MKAYIVSSEWSNGSVITFASSPSKAKSIAMQSLSLCDEDFIDLRAVRCKEADQFFIESGGQKILEGRTALEQRYLRELGWYSFDHKFDECGSCGLYFWPDVPESELKQLDDGSMICQECMRQENNNETT